MFHIFCALGGKKKNNKITRHSLGLWLVLRGCLFASVRSRCVVSHKSNICISVSASGSGAKSILRRVVTAALTGTVSALQSSLSSVHTVVCFVFLNRLSQSSVPFLSPLVTAFLFSKFKWSVGTLKLASWNIHGRGSEPVLYTSEDLSRYCINIALSSWIFHGPCAARLG